MQHFRGTLWHPRLFDRSYANHEQPVPVDDARILASAEEAWRNLAAAQRPPEIEPAFARELDRIVAAARNELLTD